MLLAEHPKSRESVQKCGSLLHFIFIRTTHRRINYVDEIERLQWKRNRAREVRTLLETIRMCVVLYVD